VHIAADTRCRPVVRVVTAGQSHDSIAFDAVMANLRIERPGRGRPRSRPDRVLADKAYSSMAIRTALRARGIKATIPSKAGEITGRAHRGSKGGRPPAFDKAAYKTRNVVEAPSTSSARPEQSRPAATRESSSTAAPSTSPRSGSGSVTRLKRIYGTRPS
jgi:transposase